MIKLRVIILGFLLILSFAFISANTTISDLNVTSPNFFGNLNWSYIQNVPIFITGVNDTLGDSFLFQTGSIVTQNMTALDNRYISYIGANQNVNLGIYNITASHFIGDGSLLTNVTPNPLTLDQIGNPVSAKTFTMGTNSLTFKFTSPASSGFLINFTGGAPAIHLFEVTSASDPAFSGHASHFEVNNINAIAIHGMNDVAGGTAILATGNINSTNTIYAQNTKNLSIGYDYTTNNSFVPIGYVSNNTFYPYSSNPLAYWNSTFATFNKTYADILYGNATNNTFYLRSNPYSYYNSTTLPSSITGAGTATYIPLWNGTTSLNNSVIYQNGSNIGIGTSNPNGTLTIQGTNLPDLLINNTGNSGAVLQMAANGNANSWRMQVINSTIAGRAGHIEISDFGGLGPVFTIANGTGDVGIGTINPTQRLVVNGSGETHIELDSNSNVGLVLNASTSLYPFIRFQQGGIGKFEMGVDPPGNFYLNPNTASGNASAAMYINKATGNVGINTTTPQNTLNVVGSLNVTGNSILSSNANVTGNLTIANAGNSGPAMSAGSGIYFLNSTGQADTYIWRASGNALRFTSGNSMAFGNGTADFFVINPTGNGNIGIGTSTPQNTLNVFGSFNASGTAGTYSWFNGLRVNGIDGSVNQIWQSNSGTTLGITANGGTISFGQTSQQQMVILSNGNVGIGTTNPSQVLSIQTPSGGSWLSAGDAVNFATPSLFGSFGNGDAAIYTQGGYPIDFYTNATQRMKILANGYIGINVANPVARLHLNDGTNNNLLIDGATGIAFQSVNDTDSGYRPMNFYASQFTLQNGNVGIGTTNPLSALDLGSGGMVTTSSIPFQFGNISSTYNKTVIYANDGTNTFDIDLSRLSDSSGATPYNFLISARGGTPFLKINGSTGNTGIGISNPSVKLHLSSAGNDAIRISNTNTAGGKYSYMQFETPNYQIASNKGLEIGVEDNTGLAYFTRATNSGAQPSGIVIDSTGNVGIGTTTFAGGSFLNVGGGGNPASVVWIDPTALNIGTGLAITAGVGGGSYSMQAAGNILTSGCLVYNGGTLGVCVSDSKLKNNINYINYSNPLNQVLSMKPATYHLNSDNNSVLLNITNGVGMPAYTGLIAEDVQKYAPELVVQDNKTGYLSVRYGDIQWVTIGAIQQQQQIIQQQNKTINKLQSEICVLDVNNKTGEC